MKGKIFQNLMNKILKQNNRNNRLHNAIPNIKQINAL